VSALAVTFFLLPTAYVWMERRKAGRTAGRADRRTEHGATARPPDHPTALAEDPT
jgi:uncharacterized iron-regulated membrane protein